MPLKIMKNWKRDCVVLADEESSVQGLLVSSNFFSGILLFLESTYPRAPGLVLVPPLVAPCCVDTRQSTRCHCKWVVHHLIYNPLVGTCPVPA